MEQTEHIDTHWEQALSHIEAGSGISDEQLAALTADEELTRDVLAAKTLQSALRSSHHPVDVDARLKEFHRQHPVATTRRLRPRLLTAVAAAAAIIGIVLLLGHGFNWYNAATEEDSSQSAQANIPAEIFTADKQQGGLTLTNERGEAVSLSPATRQNTSVSLADFRRVLSGAKTERVTLSVPFGKSADVTLPDGSVAILHPGSRLLFPTAFSGRERIVMLEGEAYFKVTHDELHPFVVMAGDIETTVHGTEFNIDTRHKEVVLVSGCVSVKNGERSATLKPHQLLSLADGNMKVADDVDITPYEMWRDGYLYFDNIDLKTILEAIGRNFNMTVEFRNTDALNYKMRFITERNKGVEVAIEMMNRMKKINISYQNGQLVVE